MRGKPGIPCRCKQVATGINDRDAGGVTVFNDTATDGVYGCAHVQMSIQLNGQLCDKRPCWRKAV